MNIETTTSESIINKLKERGFEIDELTKEWIRVLVVKGQDNAYRRGLNVDSVRERQSTPSIVGRIGKRQAHKQ